MHRPHHDRAWKNGLLILRSGSFFLLLLAISSSCLAADGPASPDPQTMSDTALLATVRQLTEQKVGLTKYAQPKMSGRAREFAERFMAVAVQASTKLNDLAAVGLTTAADAGSPTLPDEVGAVQGLEGPALNAKYVQSMLDLSRQLLPIFEEMDKRTKNAKLRAFGHESLEGEHGQIKELETLLDR